MYQVFIIDEKGKEIEVHSPFSDDLKLTKAKIKKGINTFDSFNFTILPNNPAYGKIKQMTSLVRVIDTLEQKEIFRGRILSPTDEMSSDGSFDCSYTCASEMSYLQDSIQKYKKVQNSTPEQFFRYLIDVHNATVEAYKRFTVGVVNVTNSTDNVYRYVSDTATTWDTIKDKLIDRLGGELRVRRVGDINYIDYVTEIGVHDSTVIELSKNLLSLSKTSDPTNLITRLYPRGARLDADATEEVGASQPRLTIASVNGGVEYLDASEQLKSEFGILAGAVEWDDVTTPSILLSKGRQFLNEQKTTQVQYSVSAADLSLLDMDFNRFSVGNYVFLKNSFMGINDELRIVSVGIDLIDVAESDLVIGDRFLTLSQYQAEMKRRSKAIDDLASITASLTSFTKFNQEKLEELENKVIKDLENRVKELENTLKPIGKIIDVSEHQGEINWSQAKADGLELAIIRVQDGNYEDAKHIYNINQCQLLNIKYAVYAVARYNSLEEAANEAELFNSRVELATGTATKPAFYMIDIETQSMIDVRAGTEAWQEQMIALAVPEIQQVARISNNMYEQFNINVERFGSIVIPAYRETPPDFIFDLWKYTDSGNVAGIVGNVGMSKEPSDRFKSQYLNR